VPLEAAPGLSDVASTTPAGGRNSNAIPDECAREAHLCTIAGMTYAEAIKLKGWPWKEKSLRDAVRRWRKRHPPQAMLPIEQTRQVAAMQAAGKPNDEIAAWLVLQQAEQPAVT
jgi:hypothetical protein